MKKILINTISESEFTVQGHGVHTAYIELANALRRRNDCEVVVNKNDAEADIVHIHTYGIYALMRLLFNKGKKVISAHLIIESFIGSIRGAEYLRWFAGWYLKFFYKRADLLLPVSETVSRVVTSTMGLDSKKVHTFYNSIDTKRYQPTASSRRTARQKLGIQSDTQLVIGNGQVQPRKRVDIMIEMAKRLPEIQFIWVGGIPFGSLAAEYGSMKELMASVPSNMTITGVISLDEVKKYYHAADVFVLPAMQENHPLCVLEAAASGLPIILRKIPEYQDSFGTDAYYAQDDEDFEKCVIQMLKEPKLRQKYQAGAKAIAQRFDSAVAAEKFMSLCRQVLAD